MPKKHINYGTKKMIYEKARPKISRAPIIALLSPDEKVKQRYSEHGLDHSPADFHIRSCYCSECQSTFSIDNDIPIKVSASQCYGSEWCPSPKSLLNDQNDSEFFGTDTENDEKDTLQKRFRKLATELSCPQCGNECINMGFLLPMKQSDLTHYREDQEKKHINYDGAWRIPPAFHGRYMFEYKDESGKTTRLDDNTMMDNMIIFPSGKSFKWQTEYSQMIDFTQNRILSAATRIDGNGRTPIGKAKSVLDPLLYAPRVNSISINDRVDVNDIKRCSSLTSTDSSLGAIISYRDDVATDMLGNSRMLLHYTNENMLVSYYRSTYTLSAGIPTYDESCDYLSTEDAPKNTPANVLFNEMYRDTAKIKAHKAMEQLNGVLPHPIYSDLVHNGLMLTVHRKDSTEENTSIDTVKQDLFSLITIKYPVAVEYAASRAELRAVNYEFSEKRKANETDGYTAKTATDSARAKFFREEMQYVAEQLAACDDKVLNEIRLASQNDAPCYVFAKDENGNNTIQKVDHYVSPEVKERESENVRLMKDRLSFFVYGLREGYPVPNEIAPKLKDNKTLQSATNATKKLKSSFEMDPIATASNVYTLQKWNITNQDHVKTVLDLMKEQSPEVNPAPIRIRGKRITPSRKYTRFVNANILSPLRDRTTISFAKTYGATHDTLSMIQQIFDNQNGETGPAYGRNWGEFAECVRLYDDIANNKKLEIPKTKADLVGKDAPSSEISRDDRKIQLRTYLENSGPDGLKNAYRDFTPIYGENTEETINTLAREITVDKKLDEIKRYANENGMEAALATYKDDLAEYTDPEQTINEHEFYSDRTLRIGARDGKPLFERSMKELHDELSVIARKSIVENEYLNLSDKVLSLNDTIEADLSELPKSQWVEESDDATPVQPGTMGEFSFHVLDNRYDFVRTAERLSNCVAGGGYFSNVKNGRSVIVSMQDENGATVACIELEKTRGEASDYCVAQFQGKHDATVDVRYSNIFKEWCDAHNIDYERDKSGNVHSCFAGEKDYFFGEMRDFHDEEYDAVSDIVVPKSKMTNIRENRIQKSIEIYGELSEGVPNLPEVPEDLQGFDFSK